MKKIIISLVFLCLSIFFAPKIFAASEFELLVLPVDIFSVCENYYCFPEISNIIADDVINNLNQINGIHAKSLAEVRAKIYNSKDLKLNTEIVLRNFKNDNNIDFSRLKKISNALGAKSVVIITSYATNDKSPLKRNLWEILEICSMFNTSYPFSLTTNVVMTDSVNDIIMWSTKLNKTITNSNGYFAAHNIAQANSQLEKMRLYSKENASKNISQNINLRLFPKDVREVNVQPTTDETTKPQFMPNALERLLPSTLKQDNIKDSGDNVEDFIFQF